MAADRPWWGDSRDYLAARARFLDAAASAGAVLHSHQHSLRGPAGDRLHCDVAILGDADAPKVLVLISGVHGVEGITGSSVQSAFLEDRVAARLDSGTAVVVVHALNPHGLAWLRRVNEDGVDVARNFTAFGDAAPVNAEFDGRLAAALVPVEWSGPARQEADDQLSTWSPSTQVGARLFEVIPRGQYRHPFAPFYGGDRPTWSRRLLERIVDDLVASRTGSVGVLDYHTGLGPRGRGQLIGFHPRNSTVADLGHRAWGDDYVPNTDGDSVSYPMTGGILDGIEATLGVRPFIAAAHEFGTAPPVEVLTALRADHWLHHYGDLDSPDAETIKQQIRTAFDPDDPDWQRQVCDQARRAQHSLIDTLNQR